MVAFGKRLITSTAYGTLTGSVLYLLGTLAHAAVSSLNPILFFAIGFTAPFAIAFAEDLKEKKEE